MCDEWAVSLEAFITGVTKDIGPPPHGGLTLDRLDSRENYRPGNVQWSPVRVQARNTTTNRNLTWNNRTQHCAAWARELGFSISCIYARLKRGWSTHDTLSTPEKKKPTTLKMAA